MLDSVLRVTRSQESGWSIEKEPAHERYLSGIQDIQKGKRVSFAKMMYTRVFYPEYCGNFENKGTLNTLLELSLEDIDSSTLIAVQRSKMTNWVSRD
jgi:hypothetical protein